MSEKLIIRTITKKLLRFILSKETSKHPITPKALREAFLTPKFIEENLNLELADYNKMQKFNFEQTQIIVNHLFLDHEEIQKGKEKERNHRNRHQNRLKEGVNLRLEQKDLNKLVNNVLIPTK